MSDVRGGRCTSTTARERAFPVGASVTVQELERDPHPLLRRLRECEPVSWVPALDGWLVTRHDLAVAAMRDAERFTVDDDRFSTARVVGPSMLSLDGHEHARHRAPFIGPFRVVDVRQRFEETIAAEARSLAVALRDQGQTGELRSAFAAPLAAAVVTHALGLKRDEVPGVLRSYEAIVESVTLMSAGGMPTTAGREAYARLSARLREVVDGEQDGSLLSAASGNSDLSSDQVASNAAVLLFGGIETTEAMIANALVMLLERPEALAAVTGDPAMLDAAIDESSRLEPAAAVIDRYATDATRLGSARVAAGELVRISLTGANRDPRVFRDPDAFDPARPRRGNLAFAQGPHVCVGVHLARLEARIGIGVLLDVLPRLRLADGDSPRIEGLVFRKPPRLHARWA